MTWRLPSQFEFQQGVAHLWKAARPKTQRSAGPETGRGVGEGSEKMALANPDRTQLKRFLAAYFAYVFLFDSMLAYAIYTALFQLRGLGITDIAILLAFWSGAAIVLELPSGALSDHLDRRWLLVAAPLIKALTFVCWGFAGGRDQHVLCDPSRPLRRGWITGLSIIVVSVLPQTSLTLIATSVCHLFGSGSSAGSVR